MTRATIRFLRRGHIVELRPVPPMLTLLDYLRLEEKSKGTKEGCNEGDCGACTVALGSLEGARVVYEPVNACILLLGQIDGKELITVDDLASDELGVASLVGLLAFGDAIERDVKLGDRDDVAVAQQVLLALGQLAAVDLSAVGAAEIFDEEERAIARDPGVRARDGLLGEHDLALGVAAQRDDFVFEQH